MILLPFERNRGNSEFAYALGFLIWKLKPRPRLTLVFAQSEKRPKVEVYHSSVPMATLAQVALAWMKTQRSNLKTKRKRRVK